MVLQVLQKPTATSRRQAWLQFGPPQVSWWSYNQLLDLLLPLSPLIFVLLAITLLYDVNPKRSMKSGCFFKSSFRLKRSRSIVFSISMLVCQSPVAKGLWNVSSLHPSLELANQSPELCDKRLGDYWHTKAEALVWPRQWLDANNSVGERGTTEAPRKMQNLNWNMQLS